MNLKDEVRRLSSQRQNIRYLQESMDECLSSKRRPSTAPSIHQLHQISAPCSARSSSTSDTPASPASERSSTAVDVVIAQQEERERQEKEEQLRRKSEMKRDETIEHYRQEILLLRMEKLNLSLLADKLVAAQERQEISGGEECGRREGGEGGEGGGASGRGECDDGEVSARPSDTASKTPADAAVEPEERAQLLRPSTAPTSVKEGAHAESSASLDHDTEASVICEHNRIRRSCRQCDDLRKTFRPGRHILNILQRARTSNSDYVAKLRATACNKEASPVLDAATAHRRPRTALGQNVKLNVRELRVPSNL